MAEFAQYRLEEIIPELEAVENLELLDKKEIRHVIKKRKTYEYRIQRRLKSKDDYLKYVQYECNLLMILQLRQQRLGRNYGQFKQVKKSIANRIKKLFKQAVFRYPADVKLWISFIEFCRRMKWSASISSVYASMLKVHNNKQDLWLSAAKWEWEENASMDTARQLLMRALRFLPQSRVLYLEFFRMELLNTSIQRRKVAEENSPNQNSETMETDPILSGKLVEAVYANAIKTFEDVDFFIRLIHICQEFDFTESLQNKIYAEMESMHSTDESVKAMIAIRPLKRSTEEDADVTLLEQQCFSNFEAAVKSLPTETMWSLYVNFCLERLASQRRSRGIEKRTVRHLLDVLSRAADASLLAFKQFVQWTELMSYEDHKECSRILQLATERFPQEEFLWTERISYLLRTGQTSEKKINQLFDQAFKSLRAEASLTLWKLAVRWNAAQNVSELEPIFERGLKMSSEVAKEAKVLYLEWTTSNKSIESTRALYKRLWSFPPVSLEFFYKMLDIEEANLQPSLKHLRKVVDDACSNYGKKEIDLWIRSLKVESLYAEPPERRTALIYSRAIRQLEPGLVDRFVALYTVLTNETAKTNGMA